MSFDGGLRVRWWHVVHVLIPFVQGNVFRHYGDFIMSGLFKSLNPFRTGQCLSTAQGDFSLCDQ